MIKVHIGQMNEQVTIQGSQFVPNDSGGGAETWVDEATVWARIEAGSGNEVLRASRLQTEVDMVVTIYYRTGLDVKKRLLWGTKHLDIKRIVDVEQKHQYMQVWCQDKGPSR